MIFTIIFWALMAVALIVYFILGQINRHRDDIVLGIASLATAFLIIAIVTKDPIFVQFGVPAEYE